MWACVHGTCVRAGTRACVLALADILKKKNRMCKIFVILHQNFGDLKYRVKLLTINALEMYDLEQILYNYAPKSKGQTEVAWLGLHRHFCMSRIASTLLYNP